MHQQIKASPKTTAENIRLVVDALAAANVTVQSVGPDFQSPHVRVAVMHKDPYDPKDMSDPFNRALDAIRKIPGGFDPTIVPAVEEVAITTAPSDLKIALDTLTENDVEVASILVVPGGGADELLVSFGVVGEVDPDWEDRATELQQAVQKAIDSTR